MSLPHTCLVGAGAGHNFFCPRRGDRRAMLRYSLRFAVKAT